MLDKQHSSSTINVYVAAIAAFHAPIAGLSVGRDSAVIQFLRGARRMNPPRTRTVPSCDLPTALRALKYPPFEPLQSSSLKTLSLKTAPLLALASVKRVGDLQSISINPACLEFGPNDSKVVLKPRLGYVPKVLSTPFRAFCLVQKVRTVFFGFGNHAKGGPVTKQRISRWLVDAITLA